MRRLNVLLIVALLACARAATADVQILVEGESGSSFGAARHLLTDANGSVDLRPGNFGEARVQWARADGISTPALEGFDAHFAGPHAARLQIGTYSGVSRLVSPNSESPGMHLAGCNQLTGSFEVLDVAYDSQGTLLRLALNLEHHCEGGPRADRIRIRVNTAVPLQPPGVTANAGVDVRAAPGSTVVLDASASHSTFVGPLAYSWSQISGPAAVLQNAAAAQAQVSLPAIEGEYAFLKFAVRVRDSQGNEAVDEVTLIDSSSLPRSQLAISTPASSPFGELNIVSDMDVAQLQLRRNFRNGIDLEYLGPISGYVFPPRLDINWSAPLLQELREGEYDVAYRHAFAPISKSGLDFTFILGCGQLIGYFTVLDVAYDEFGRVERLAVDLLQSCLDDPGADQFTAASIRYNSVVPLVSRVPHASAGQDLEMFSGDAVSLFGGLSNGGASDIVEYRWRQLSGPAVTLGDAQSDAPTFVAPDVPLGGAALVFELTVRNAAGYEDIDVVRVRVLGTQDERSWIYMETFASEGCSFLLATCNGARETLTRNGGDLELSRQRNDDGSEWLTVHYLDYDLITFTLRSAPGQLLEPGRVYLDLSRDNLQGAGFELAVTGRACNLPRSSMTIHELERDAQGRPISLAADYVIACDGNAPVYGSLRVETTLPKTPSRPLASAGYDQQVVIGDVARLTGSNSFVGSGVASYEWTQISGAPIALTGSGADATFAVPATAGTLVFRLTVHGADGSVHSDDIVVTVPAAGTRRSRILMESAAGDAIGFGRRHEMDASLSAAVRESNANSFRINAPWSGFPATMWNLTIHAPFDQPLGPTNYPGIRDVNRGGLQNHSIYNAPGMDFDWEGYHCLDAHGRYFVHEYVLNPNGQVERLAVDLVQSCGVDGPLTRAAVRMNSAVPLRTAAPSASAGPDQVVRGGRRAELDGRYSVSWLDRSLTYSWVQISGEAVQLSSSIAVRPTFTAPVVTQDETIRFELAVSDAAGLRAVDTVNVLILAPTTPSSDVRLEIGSRSIAAAGPQEKLVSANLIEHSANDSYLRVQNNAPDVYLSYLGDVSVNFILNSYAMRDGRLRPGNWTFESGLADAPTIAIGSDIIEPTQCLSSGGLKSLRITEAQYDASGNLSRLAFGFRYDCRDIVLTGIARYSSADTTVSVPDHVLTPPPPPPPPPQPPSTPPPPSGGANSSKGGGGASDPFLLLGLAALLSRVAGRNARRVR